MRYWYENNHWEYEISPYNCFKLVKNVITVVFNFYISIVEAYEWYGKTMTLSSKLIKPNYERIHIIMLPFINSYQIFWETTKLL